jgi:hypothetical protein
VKVSNNAATDCNPRVPPWDHPPAALSEEVLSADSNALTFMHYSRQEELALLCDYGSWQVQGAQPIMSWQRGWSCFAKRT